MHSDKSIFGWIITAVVVIIALFVVFGSWTIIDEGERGVVLNVGKVDRIMSPGFNWKTPFIEGVVVMEVRTLKIETEATAASKDLQDVTTNVAVQYNLNADDVGTIYKEYETQLKQREIDPAIQDVVKAATAQFTAEELITRRAEVKGILETKLRERLANKYVTISGVDIINFAFSESFSQAIEEKVTAEQNASREENRLKEIEFRAQQTIETAKAEAESIRIQAEAINSQGGADYVEKLRIEKWNGAGCTSYCGLDTSTGLLIQR